MRFGRIGLPRTLSPGFGRAQKERRSPRSSKEIGLRKRIGWHTFRHTFGTILNANGENPKVIQELMRHANLKVTMDTYVQAVTDEKREAQNKVVKMLLPGIRRAVI
jgi:integrase